jgi:hypothetical protein
MHILCEAFIRLAEKSTTEQQRRSQRMCTGKSGVRFNCGVGQGHGLINVIRVDPVLIERLRADTKLCQAPRLLVGRSPISDSSSALSAVASILAIWPATSDWIANTLVISRS